LFCRSLLGRQRLAAPGVSFMSRRRWRNRLVELTPHIGTPAKRLDTSGKVDGSTVVTAAAPQRARSLWCEKIAIRTNRTLPSSDFGLLLPNGDRVNYGEHRKRANLQHPERPQRFVGHIPTWITVPTEDLPFVTLRYQRFALRIVRVQRMLFLGIRVALVKTSA
jgi:hypothetical protein